MIFVKIFYFLSVYTCFCEEVRKTLPYPSFREKIEENTIRTIKTENPDKNLYSFLFQNLKEIFTIPDEPTVLLDEEIEDSTMMIEKIVNIDKEPANDVMYLNVFANSKNVTETSKHINKENNKNSTMIQELTIKNDLLNLSRVFNIQLVGGDDRKINSLESFDYSKTVVEETTTSTQQYNTTKRSCIFCNNIDIESCSDPKNKLIPSILCEEDEDICYSQHTPFGLVDRGCYNINRNITTYFCACNLCNYIAISEMPHIFSRKQDWVENVIEITRNRRLRQSIYKDMSCLRCEVNITTKSGDILDNTSCLEGNIGGLPLQLCAENEICAVKAIRSDGYLWRGCVSRPLYNYWWTLCDTDLCNVDALVSMFDKH